MLCSLVILLEPARAARSISLMVLLLEGCVAYCRNICAASGRAAHLGEFFAVPNGSIGAVIGRNEGARDIVTSRIFDKGQGWALLLPGLPNNYSFRATKHAVTGPPQRSIPRSCDELSFLRRNKKFDGLVILRKPWYPVRGVNTPLSPALPRHLSYPHRASLCANLMPPSSRFVQLSTPKPEHRHHL